MFLLRVVPFNVGPRWDFVPEGHPQTAKAFADTGHDAEVYLAEVAERVRTWAPRVHSHVVFEGHVEKAITDYAREQQVDLIAMASHGRGGIERALLGSVAERVMRSSGVPVLLLPVRATEHAGAAFAVEVAM